MPAVAYVAFGLVLGAFIALNWFAFKKIGNAVVPLLILTTFFWLLHEQGKLVTAVLVLFGVFASTIAIVLFHSYYGKRRTVEGQLWDALLAKKVKDLLTFVPIPLTFILIGFSWLFVWFAPEPLQASASAMVGTVFVDDILPILIFLDFLSFWLVFYRVRNWISQR